MREEVVDGGASWLPDGRCSVLESKSLVQSDARMKQMHKDLVDLQAQQDKLHNNDVATMADTFQTQNERLVQALAELAVETRK